MYTAFEKLNDKADNNNFIKFITYANESEIILKVGQDNCSRLSSYLQRAKKLSFHPYKNKQTKEWSEKQLFLASRENEVERAHLHLEIWRKRWIQSYREIFSYSRNQ